MLISSSVTGGVSIARLGDIFSVSVEADGSLAVSVADGMVLVTADSCCFERQK